MWSGIITDLEWPHYTLDLLIAITQLHNPSVIACASGAYRTEAVDGRIDQVFARSLQYRDTRAREAPVTLRALLGGCLFLSAVALWHRPSLLGRGAGAGDGTGCPAAGGAQLCASVAGLAAALRNPILQMDDDILPPVGTLGAIDPKITQATIDRTICRPGYARGVRPPYAVTAPLKRHLMDVQHPGGSMADYELDHLIPISLGGAPFDMRNLWLQPRRGRANAADKNVLAYVLWRLVCEHRVPLETAQRAMTRDWTEAYATYATPANVDKYHFRLNELPSE